MYSNPTRLPQTTNREDLQFTVSIYDDDTGMPVNLSGVTSLQNQNGFLGLNWIVTDGSIAAASTTLLIVPGYPVTNELTALTLAIAPGLLIAAGDPVTVADAAGNASMIGYVTSYGSNSGTLTVQVGMAFELEIRSLDHYQRQHDYSAWFDWGGGPPFDGGRPIIRCQLGNGLSIIDMGYLQVNIPAATLQRLTNKTYLIALTMTDGVNTRQIFLGELPVLYGGTIAGLTSAASGQPNFSSLLLTEDGTALLTTETAQPLIPAPVPPLPPVPPPGSESDNIPAGVP